MIACSRLQHNSPPLPKSFYMNPIIPCLVMKIKIDALDGDVYCSCVKYVRAWDKALFAKMILPYSSNKCVLTVDLFERSEERRVGKECRSKWWSYHSKEQYKDRDSR